MSGHCPVPKCVGCGTSSVGRGDQHGGNQTQQAHHQEFEIRGTLMTRYYKLSDDVAVPGRWELGKLSDERGDEVWPALLMRGEPAEIEGRIRAPVKLAGQPLDFSQAAFGIPIVHVRVESVFMELAKNDVQFFPVEIEGCSDQYRILNVTRVVKCIDDHASEEVRYWKPEDG